MSDSLWSPQMRKWARDSHRHGIPIGFYKTRPVRDRAGGETAGGGGNPYTTRLADDGGMRIIDSPAGQFGNQPRTIDKPIGPHLQLPTWLTDETGKKILVTETGLIITAG